MNGMSFSSRLRAGQSLISTFIKPPSHAVVEIAGDCMLDAVVLDAEHAPFDQSSLDRSLLACRAAQVAGLVRVADERPTTLLQALDLGADGLVLPHIVVTRSLPRSRTARHWTTSRRSQASSRSTACWSDEPIWPSRSASIRWMIRASSRLSAV
jgi:2-keto-3-deoxy-L-rhamnonate aldolase RhmA